MSLFCVKSTLYVITIEVITVNLTVAEKIRILLGRRNMTMTDLAEKLNMSRQNLANKMKRDNFSEKEIAEIAKVLNVEYEINFVLDGVKI